MEPAIRQSASRDIEQVLPQRQVFCISGLGADERIFSKLKIPGISLQHLQWLTPEKNEEITSYASRMTRQVPVCDPILLGVSFGGMMAIEMAKHCPAARVILVSSIKSHHELPPWMKLCGRLHLADLLPHKPWRWASLENNFLGAETPEDIRLCNEYRKNTNPDYIRWSLGQVLNWTNEWVPSTCYHIHGSKDKTFPVKYVKPTHVIAGGGHFMIMNRAQEANAILTQILMELC